jgi:hypothetical protein
MEGNHFKYSEEEEEINLILTAIYSTKNFQQLLHRS